MIKRLTLFCTLCILLISCGNSEPAQPVEAVEEIVVTNTPEPPPPTSTPIPPTATDTPVLEPIVLFEDEFDAELGEGWTWVREERNRWSLSATPGFMQILLQPDGLGGGFPRNVLLREAPEGEFEIETRLVFEPRSNFQIAALLVYQDDDNAVQFGRAHCDVPDGCVGNGLYFDNFIDGDFTGSNFAINLQNPSEVYLKIHRDGSTFTAYYSENGQNWIPVGEHTNLLEVTSIGLIAAQSYQPAVVAEFDYFRVYQIP